MENILEVKNLHVVFNTFDGVLEVLRNINLEIARGEAIGLVGETGSGKSVLSQTIMGILPVPGQVTGGEIVFKGEDLLKLSRKKMERDIRGKGISMVLQSPMTSLNPLFKVKDQMTEVIRTHTGASQKEALAKAETLLRTVHVPDPKSVLEKYPFELSGGMAQRVMIAMSVTCNPSLIIADEPTTALDVTVEKQIIRLMKEIIREFDSSLIWISHDLSVVKQVCEKIAVMYGGTIVEIGDGEEILSSPLHPYTKALIEARPSAMKRGKALKSIEGSVASLLEVPEGCIFEARCEQRSDRCRKGLAPELITLESGRKVACHKYLDKEGL